MADSYVRISRILHAGYVFSCEQTQIAFDPIFENPFSHNCYAFPNVRFDLDRIRTLQFDAVFISHFHDDHCSLTSLNCLNRATPIYLYCIHDEIFCLIKELGFLNVHRLEIDEPITIGAFDVIPCQALDADVDAIFHVKAQGLNILNVVDAMIDPVTLTSLSRLAPWDIVLWPFQNLLETDVLAPTRAIKSLDEKLPAEWIDEIRKLNPRYIVPSSCQFIHESWSWYNDALFSISYSQFQREIESSIPTTQVVRLNPSVSIELTKSDLKFVDSLSWVHPVGDQDVDYRYSPPATPPPTSSIARRFNALSKKQTEGIDDYCRTGLIHKYRSLEETCEAYFQKTRLWRLSVYDHLGTAQNYHYLLERNKIELIEPMASANARELGWTTEIAAAKLYAALNDGEALTSLYIRINSEIFNSDIECDLQSVDIVEDPLIRCLYTGSPASYQTAQLERILSRP